MGDLPGSKNDVAIDIPKQSIIQRVPAQVREGKDRIYDPVLVSLGPYHRGRSSQQFKQAEDLKPEILRLLLSGGLDKDLLREIHDRLGEVKSFYDDDALDGLDDEALAQMMLRDAAFLVYCMKKLATHDERDEKDNIVLHRLGMPRVAFLIRDFFMLENQLPFFLLNKAISLTERLESKAADAFFYKLLISIINCGDSSPYSNNLLQDIAARKESALHLLDACRVTLVQKEEITLSEEETTKTGSEKSQFRSVMDLKAKGIHFRPTKSNYSNCLRNISFRSHSFYGMLRLPVVILDNKTNVVFSNMIAMEMAAGSGSDLAVTSYVKFMKSLIVKEEDVKELREKGIVVSWLANDEEVVKMFKEFETEGSCRRDLYRGVRERINVHCRSKTKTFKAELIHTYFRSPWTAIALFTAILILSINCLNFLLNYYKFTTMSPKMG